MVMPRRISLDVVSCDKFMAFALNDMYTCNDFELFVIVGSSSSIVPAITVKQKCHVHVYIIPPSAIRPSDIRDVASTCVSIPQ